jgi:hypothetical protein
VWDIDIGVLPDRRVVGKYYIDGGTEYEEIMVYEKKKGDICGSKLGSSASRRRGECRPYQDSYVTRTFEVDNYFNFYEASTGLYILCNKTCFPQISFLVRPDLFKSKRVIAETWKYDSNWYKMLDARPAILAAISSLLPDQYYEKVDFYNRFRKLKTKESHYVAGAVGTSADDTTTVLIREQQQKIEHLLKTISLSETYNTELLQKYQDQSKEFVDLTRQLHTERASYEITKTQAMQDLNIQICMLTKQLSDATAYRARNIALGQDLDQLQEALSKSKLELQKYKDSNAKLTEQVLEVKKQIRDKSEEINALTIRYGSQDCTMLQHITSINMLTKKLELSERNADELSARMLKSVHQDDALEQALLTQVETLREQKRKADEDYKELNSKYTAMERDHTSLRKKLSALIG